MAPRAQLGTSPATAQLVPGIVSAAGTISTGALAIAGATAAIPIVGAAVAAVTLGLFFLFGNGKSGAQKVQSTHIVDDLENNATYGLKQNLAAYESGPRTRASQQLALSNFDASWAYLVSSNACGASSLDDAGKACIADRKRGGKWDWFALYRDPIANDPGVIDNPASDAIIAALPAGILSTSDVNVIEKFWLPIVLLLLALIL